MTDSGKSEPLTLKRWSQRKLAAARDAQTTPSAEPPKEAAAAAAPPAAVDASPPQKSTADASPRELPPLDSLTLDSDFSAFLRPDVDETLKRGALRKLFTDPRFNVMDGLDVYIDDYSKPDPIAPEIVRQLVQARYLFDPPATRVNADGYVEDVPADEAAEIGTAAQADELPPPARTPMPTTEVPAQSADTADVQAELPLARDTDAPSS